MYSAIDDICSIFFRWLFHVSTLCGISDVLTLNLELSNKIGCIASIDVEHDTPLPSSKKNSTHLFISKSYTENEFSP
jgi:hypothetical protein